MQVRVDFVDSLNAINWVVELTDRDEIFLNEVWYKSDVLLDELKDQEPFRNRTRWSDLEMIHYQLLLFKCFDLLGPDTPLDDLTIRYKEPFSTFRFFASAIVKMSRVDGVTGFDEMTIMRPKESRIVVDFRRTFRFDWDAYIPPRPEPKVEVKKNPFHVIVDNTK